MSKASPTPEEIAAMEETVRNYRVQEAQAAQEKAREAAAPLLDIIDSDELKVIEEKLPALKELARDDTVIPNLDIHLKAFTIGLDGLRQLARMVAPPPAIPPGLPGSEMVTPAAQ